MKSFFLAVRFFILTVMVFQSAMAVEPSAASGDWPWWRGPDRNGTASDSQNPPTRWSERENIRWRAPIAGRGHGSPTVVGNDVLVASADPQREVQVVLCFDRQSGKQRWESVVHEGGFANKSKREPNEKASLASSTVASDGERLFINFINDSVAWTTALDRNGKILWQQRISDYIIHQGYGSSPAIYQDLVIVSADNKGGGAIAAMNRETGQVVWRRERPEKPNYASPAILNVDGRDQLIFTGCDLVTSLDPSTGEELWEIEGATTECVTTAVTDGTHIFTSGGYPLNHISAVAADGSGKVVWENQTRAYVPSLLQHDGFLYATLDAGIATCFRCSDGEEMWKARLGGTFSSSPVRVGDRIYGTNEDGETFIFQANPNKFVKLGENKLGESVFATPAICGDHIFTRVAHYQNNRRQEYLYCIGQ